MIDQIEAWTHDSIRQIMPISNKTATFDEYIADLCLILGDYHQLTSKDINTCFVSYGKGLSTEDVVYQIIG